MTSREIFRISLNYWLDKGYDIAKSDFLIICPQPPALGQILAQNSCLLAQKNFFGQKFMLYLVKHGKQKIFTKFHKISPFNDKVIKQKPLSHFKNILAQNTEKWLERPLNGSCSGSKLYRILLLYYKIILQSMSAKKKIDFF